MFRFLLFLSLFSSTLFSKTIHFSEEKFLDAISMTFSKKGTIVFEEERIEVSYDNEDKKLIYLGDTLRIEEDKEVEIIDLNKYPSAKMLFLLFDAIYFDKKDVLKPLFTLDERKGVIYLKPKELISAYVKKVSYKKRRKRLEFLKIELRDKDQIYIEEID